MIDDNYITALMIDAEQYAHDICGFCGHTDYNTIRNRKFAELIVRECTEVGSQWANGLIDTNHYAFVNKQIKRYFGVEQ